MQNRQKFPVEVRERPVRLVVERQSEPPSQRAALTSIAAKIGCPAETPHKWVRQAGRDADRRPRLSTGGRARVNELEREARELKHANEVLRQASANFAQAELDRRPK